MFIEMDAVSARQMLRQVGEISTGDISTLDACTTEAIDAVQLSLHVLLQEEAVDPAPPLEESKVELDLDDPVMQYVMAQQIGSSTR